VQAAVSRGANANALDKNDSNTALIFAAKFNQNPEVITTLLRAGADAKAIADNGKTVLEYAKDNFGLKGADVLKQLEEASK
jgi:ankyrin repeat protein